MKSSTLLQIRGKKTGSWESSSFSVTLIKPWLFSGLSLHFTLHWIYWNIATGFWGCLCLCDKCLFGFSKNKETNIILLQTFIGRPEMHLVQRQCNLLLKLINSQTPMGKNQCCCCCLGSFFSSGKTVILGNPSLLEEKSVIEVKGKTFLKWTKWNSWVSWSAGLNIKSMSHKSITYGFVSFTLSLGLSLCFESKIS